MTYYLVAIHGKRGLLVTRTISDYIVLFQNNPVEVYDKLCDKNLMNNTMKITKNTSGEIREGKTISVYECSSPTSDEFEAYDDPEPVEGTFESNVFTLPGKMYMLNDEEEINKKLPGLRSIASYDVLIDNTEYKKFEGCNCKHGEYTNGKYISDLNIVPYILSIWPEFLALFFGFLEMYEPEYTAASSSTDLKKYKRLFPICFNMMLGVHNFDPNWPIFHTFLNIYYKNGKLVAYSLLSTSD